MVLIKWVGGLLIWVGCAGWGLRAAWELRRRTGLLDELADSMELLERELALHCTPLPDLLLRLAEQATPECAKFFLSCSAMSEKEKNFTETWEEAAQLLHLACADRTLVASLGRILGRFDVRGQTQAVDRVRRELERRGKKAGEEESRLGRVYGMMGVTVGSFLVLLLL